MNLSFAVGQGCRNLAPDVTAVQQLLKKAGFDPGKVDGVCGPRTVAAIVAYQRQFMPSPDGRIDPGGLTWTKLSGKVSPSSAPPTPAATGQWGGDSSQWSENKKLASMEPTLRVKVPQVLTKLTNQGFQPKIFYAWRSVAVQKRLVAEGKSTVLFSFHNAQLKDGTPNAYAADIIDKRWGWEKEAQQNGFWTALGKAAKEAGLVWGGDWTSFPDEAHVQSAPNSDLAKVKKESGL